MFFFSLLLLQSCLRRTQTKKRKTPNKRLILDANTLVAFCVLCLKKHLLDQTRLLVPSYTLLMSFHIVYLHLNIFQIKSNEAREATIEFLCQIENRLG